MNWDVIENSCSFGGSGGLGIGGTSTGLTSGDRLDFAVAVLTSAMPSSSPVVSLSSFAVCHSTIAISRFFTKFTYSTRFCRYHSGYGIDNETGTMSRSCIG